MSLTTPNGENDRKVSALKSSEDSFRSIGGGSLQEQSTVVGGGKSRCGSRIWGRGGRI